MKKKLLILLLGITRLYSMESEGLFPEALFEELSSQRESEVLFPVAEPPEGPTLPGVMADDISWEVGGIFSGADHEVTFREEKVGVVSQENKKHPCPVACRVCGYVCRNSSRLRDHFRCHTGERPFVCEWKGCNAAFRLKSTLVEHQRFHTGERPFVCSVCEKRFRRAGDCNRHEKTHLPKQSYCFGCGKWFRDDRCLRRHRKTKCCLEKGGIER